MIKPIQNGNNQVYPFEFGELSGSAVVITATAILIVYIARKCFQNHPTHREISTSPLLSWGVRDQENKLWKVNIINHNGLDSLRCDLEDPETGLSRSHLIQHRGANLETAVEWIHGEAPKFNNGILIFANGYSVQFTSTGTIVLAEFLSPTTQPSSPASTQGLSPPPRCGQFQTSIFDSHLVDSPDINKGLEIFRERRKSYL